MPHADRAEVRSFVALTATSLLLGGFMGAPDCSGGRFRSVPTRSTAVSLSGYADSTAESICAYQQTKDGMSLAAPLACATPSGVAAVDTCGVYWYSWTLNFTLLSSDAYWFGQHNPAAGSYEYTRVFVSRVVQNGGLHTGTGDFAEGPSDNGTCYRSWLAENAAVAPLTYFRGGVPDDLECSSGVNSYAGCPYTCNLPRGCDSAYGVTQNDFTVLGYRSNSSGQDTSQTRFDHYGATSASGPPSGAWGYALETGTCVGGANEGLPCEDEWACWDESAPWAYCNAATVMRRNHVTPDSLNLRRGENRRNARIEASVRTKIINANHREVGLVGRFYNADNYFVFMAREYGGDSVRLQGYAGGQFQIIASATKSMNLLGWTRLGLEISDLGSYTNERFVPNGYCAMRGFVNGSQAVKADSAYCGHAPYGKYGVFTSYMTDAMFWDVDAFPR